LVCFFLVAHTQQAPSPPDFVGHWHWNWGTGKSAPLATNWGMAFNGITDVDGAMTASSTIFKDLPGFKVLVVGGNGVENNVPRIWHSSDLDKMNLDKMNEVKQKGYHGIAFDIEVGDNGLAGSFAKAFQAAKDAGLTVIVTVSFTKPFGVGDGASLVRGFFGNTNIDYISPQMYQNGDETDIVKDFSEVTWDEYKNSKAKVVPSIPSGSNWASCWNFLNPKGVKLAGYIQWQQSGYAGPARSGGSPPPPPPPTPPPANKPTPPPANKPTPPPANKPTPPPPTKPSTCKCASGLCLSEWGYCGTSKYYCGVSHCQCGPCWKTDAATDTTGIVESNTATGTSSDEGTPGWAIGLLSLGCIIVVLLVVIVVIVVRK